MPAAPSPGDALVGRTLAERYQLLHRVGEGAMGVVYKARHVKMGRLFAVKVLHARALEDSKVLQRFEREAEAAGRLRHPNVIGVVDVGEVDGTRYMVMDFVEGPDLARLLDEAPMPAERIIRLVRQLLEGLHHAHEAGLIHRDFKPENVIVERDSHGGELPRIVDFGIALLREGSGGGEDHARLTTNGLVLGTPHYMAPEQAVADPIDHRIDLFALGIVIYEMLSGRLPFDGTGAEVARANLLLDPPPIARRVPHLEVDPLLEAFARMLMHKKRDARPATARAARELLDLIERDRPAAAVALGVPVARSGRLPAETERVDPEDAAPPDPTTRMKPTPKGSEPPLPDAPTGTAVPAWLAAGAEMSPPAGAVGVAVAAPPMVYAGPAVPPPSAYAPHAPPHRHRDTGLRTPLGWQTASRPVHRRRSWLIGGASLVTVGVVAAAAIAWSADRDAESPVDRSATPAVVVASPGERAAGAVAPAAPPAVIPAPATDDRGISPPAPSAPVASAPVATASIEPAGDSAVDPAPKPAVPVRSPGDAKRTAPPSRVRARPAAAPVSSDPPAPAPAPAAPPPRSAVAPPRAPDAVPAHPPAATPEVGRTVEPPPPARGTTAAALGVLFDQVKHEIEAVPPDRQKELLDQLAMLGVTRAMIGSQADRDEAAGKLVRLRLRVRELSR